MKKILFVVIILIMISCNKIVDTSQNIYNSYLFNKTESNSDQIIIKLYNSTKNEIKSQVYDTFPPKKIYKIIDSKEIENFDKIFDNAEMTSYCCCKNPIYSVSFLKENKELSIYYVDTIEFKNKVRFFEERWQYSYIIEKQKWKNYLSEIEN